MDTNYGMIFPELNINLYAFTNNIIYPGNNGGYDI
jgi:hypothetical protein